MNRDWTCKIQVTLLSAERNCAGTLSKHLWRSNRDGLWENDDKIHERGHVKEFFVNLQVGIPQLH